MFKLIGRSLFNSGATIAAKLPQKSTTLQTLFRRALDSKESGKSKKIEYVELAVMICAAPVLTALGFKALGIDDIRIE